MEKMHDFGWNEKESCKQPTMANQRGIQLGQPPKLGNARGIQLGQPPKLGNARLIHDQRYRTEP